MSSEIDWDNICQLSDQELLSITQKLNVKIVGKPTRQNLINGLELFRAKNPKTQQKFNPFINKQQMSQTAISSRSSTTNSISNNTNNQFKPSPLRTPVERKLSPRITERKNSSDFQKQQHVLNKKRFYTSLGLFLLFLSLSVYLWFK